VKGNETGVVCGCFGARGGALKIFLRVKSEGKGLRDLDVNGRIIAKII
jgi:hypothetical protein